MYWLGIFLSVLGFVDSKEVNERFGLKDSRLLNLEIPQDSTVFPLHIEGIEYLIALEAHSVRSSNYRLLIQKPDGSYEDQTPGPETSYRGSVVDDPGSVIAASISTQDRQLEAKIIFSDGRKYWVEPLSRRFPSSPSSFYVLYRNSDVIASKGLCAAKSHSPWIQAPVLNPPSSNSSSNLGFPYIAELAADADFEYFQNHGSSINNVEQTIHNVINQVNVEFERDVNIRHMISAMIIRTAEPDPYDSSNSGALLNQVAFQWQNFHDELPRDVTELFTGKEIDGNIIGIAWLGGICGSSGYNVVQSDCCGSGACRSDLSAHELGHNWNAPHCECANPPFTMNPWITCSNQFSAESIQAIVAYRDSIAECIPNDLLEQLVLSGPTEVAENTTAQFAATAEFLYGPNEDVSAQTFWHILPPWVGHISSSGSFIGNEILQDTQVTIYASYSDHRGSDNATYQFTLLNTDLPIAITSSSPPHLSIDARQPSAIDGNEIEGWQSLDLNFDSNVQGLALSDFSIEQIGGSLPAPTLSSINILGPQSIRLLFNRSLEPGTWTNIRFESNDSEIRLGFLPADVNGDGTAGPADILSLIDSLNGVVNHPPFSTDINRSGVPEPSDILREIDLLNGAGEFAVWNGFTLP